MAEAVRDSASGQAPPEHVLYDEESQAVKNSVHQRLRANSSIMKLKKILGKCQLQVLMALLF
jgi:hypothetical protein